MHLLVLVADNSINMSLYAQIDFPYLIRVLESQNLDWVKERPIHLVPFQLENNVPALTHFSAILVLWDLPLVEAEVESEKFKVSTRPLHFQLSQVFYLILLWEFLSEKRLDYLFKDVYLVFYFSFTVDN